jgi:hypothetical protein
MTTSEKRRSGVHVDLSICWGLLRVVGCDLDRCNNQIGCSVAPVEAN